MIEIIVIGILAGFGFALAFTLVGWALVAFVLEYISRKEDEHGADISTKRNH